MSASRADQQVFHQDFRGQFDYTRLQLRGGNSPTSLIKLEPDGLRINVTPENASAGSRGVATRFNVSGDFDITVSYKLLRLPQPETGYGVGISLSIKDGDEQLASIQRVRRTNGDHVIVSHRAVPSRDADGKLQHEHNVSLADCDFMEGKLRLVRVGNRLHYLFSDADGRLFQAIRDVEFSDRDLTQVHVNAQLAGGGKDVDLLLTDLTISSKSTQAAVPEHARSSRINWLWIGGGIAGAALLLFGVWGVSRRYT
jgi:hypothetical protein